MGDFDCCPHDVGPEEDEMSRPDQNYTDLIADARVWPRDGVSKGPLINALADAIEALVKERDELAAVVEKVRGVIGAEIGWESPAILIDRIQWAMGDES